VWSAVCNSGGGGFDSDVGGRGSSLGGGWEGTSENTRASYDFPLICQTRTTMYSQYSASTGGLHDGIFFLGPCLRPLSMMVDIAPTPVLFVPLRRSRISIVFLFRTTKRAIDIVFRDDMRGSCRCGRSLSDTAIEIVVEGIVARFRRGEGRRQPSLVVRLPIPQGRSFAMSLIEIQNLRMKRRRMEGVDGDSDMPSKSEAKVSWRSLMKWAGRSRRFCHGSPELGVAAIVSFLLTLMSSILSCG
jgi:hypothetical protein